MPGLTNPMPSSPAAAQPAAPAPAPAPAAPPSPAPAPAPSQPAGGAQPQPAGGAPGGQQQQAKPPIGAGPMDPELYKKYVANCMNVVTGSLQAIAKMIQQSQDKPGALAQATVQVIIRVEDSLEQSGGTLNLQMTMNGGAECLTDIATTMQHMNVYQFSQQEIDQAFLEAVDKYRMIRQQQGRLDPAMFQQKIQQLKQQSQAGTLDQSYPGLTQYAQKVQKVQAKGGKQQQQQPGADADTPDTDPSEADGSAPASGTQNFPAHMLKKPNQVSVQPHYRNRPKKRKAPKMKPGQRGGMQPPKKPVPPQNNGAM